MCNRVRRADCAINRRVALDELQFTEHTKAGSLPEGRCGGKDARENNEVNSINQFVLHECVNQRRAAENPHQITVPFLLETFLDKLGLKVLDTTVEGFCGRFDAPLDAPRIEISRRTIEGSCGKDYDPFGGIGPVAVVRKHKKVVHILAEENDGDPVEKFWKAIAEEIRGAALAIDGCTRGIWVYWEVFRTVS